MGPSGGRPLAGWGRQWMNAKLQGHIVPSQSLQAESIPSLCFCTESSPSLGMLHGARFSFPFLGTTHQHAVMYLPNQPSKPPRFLLAALLRAQRFVPVRRCVRACVCTALYDKTHCKPDQKLGAPFTPDCWKFPSLFLGNPKQPAGVSWRHVRSATDGVNEITSHRGATTGAACLDPRCASAPGVSQVHFGRLPIWLGPRQCV